MPPSLYANLLDPAAPPSAATISGAPVKYSFKKEDEPSPTAHRKTPDASLRFQPAVKRPQPVQKQKPRPPPAPPAASAPAAAPAAAAAAAAAVSPGPTIQKWNDSQAQDFDVVNEYYKFQEEQKLRLKEERKAKKSKKPRLDDRDIDWSAPYSVQEAFTKTRTKQRLDAWKLSDSKYNARFQWKEALHSFRRPGTPPARDLPKPPVDISYKNMPPPVEFSAPSGQAPPPPPSTSAPPLPPFPGQALPPAHAPLSSLSSAHPPPPPPQPPFADAPTPPHPSVQHLAPPPPPPPAPATPPAPPPGVISRAPVRYEQAPPAQDTPEAPTPHASVSVESSQEPETRSSAPGQKGFAKRYMEKLGWKQGQGLGREATGITTILRHEPSKRKRKPDAEGGGWAQPAAMGRIVGGKKAKTGEPVDEAKAFSVVAKFDGMLKDVDVDRAIDQDNLTQLIGDRMNDYGRSERVYIDRATGRVFVKFTSALSAFNAIKASDGKDFLGNGRPVQSSFFNADKFEEGVYD